MLNKMAKEKEDDLEKIKKRLEKIKKDKAEIEDILSKYETTKVKIVTNNDWIIFAVVIIILAIGAVERNPYIMLVGGVAFLTMIGKVLLNKVEV